MSTWVIGGTSGIGAAIASYLNGMGFEVFVSNEEDGNVMYYREVKDYIAAHPDIDSVVYSAGDNYLEWLGRMGVSGLAGIEDLAQVNYIGFIRVLDALAAAGKQNMRIVAIGSDAAVRPMRTSIGYCASKAALSMAVKCAARELASRGWRINEVAPGMTINTEMTKYVDETVMRLRNWTASEMLDYEASQAVIQRRVVPGEIAEVVYGLLSGPDIVNGTTITVNGGR